MNKAVRFVRESRAVRLGLPTGALVAVGNARAALPADVETALEGAGADATSAGWIIVGVLALIFAVKLVMRVMR